MAGKAKFVTDFRAGVSQLLDTWRGLVNLNTEYTVMGWTKTDFDFPILPNSPDLSLGEISSQDLEDAVLTVGSMTGTFGVSAAALTKMKP
jgi:hypothetical protein